MESKISIDLYVGQRIYSRRRMLRLTQSELGSKVNSAFQQIQKYEKGLNKISASKLFDIAIALNVPIAFFFDGFDNCVEAIDNVICEESTSFQHNDKITGKILEELGLIKLYHSLNNERTKTKLIMFLDALSSD